MDFREWKLEISIVAGAVVLLLAMFSVFKSFKPSSQIESKEIVYEMPRPVSPEMESDFDLANREITREYINAQIKNAKANKPVTAIPKKEAAADKKKDDKKTAQAKKPEVKIDVIPAAQHPRMGSTDSSGGSQNKTLANPQANNTAPNDETKKQDDDKKTTIDQWRQIIMAQPTLENMNKFLTAYRNKDVSAQDYYQLSQELLAMNDKEHQAAGLYAVQSAPSATSFALVTKSAAHLTTENQATAQQILLSYSQPQKLGYLSQALQSQDADVVKQAAATITYGLSLVKKGQVVQDSRNTRGDVSTASTLESYGRFLTVFQTWQSSGDSTLVGLAQNFLNTWNS